MKRPALCAFGWTVATLASVACSEPTQPDVRVGTGNDRDAAASEETAAPEAATAQSTAATDEGVVPQPTEASATSAQPSPAQPSQPTPTAEPDTNAELPSDLDASAVSASDTQTTTPAQPALDSGAAPPVTDSVDASTSEPALDVGSCGVARTRQFELAAGRFDTRVTRVPDGWFVCAVSTNEPIVSLWWDTASGSGSSTIEYVPQDTGFRIAEMGSVGFLPAQGTPTLVSIEISGLGQEDPLISRTVFPAFGQPSEVVSFLQGTGLFRPSLSVSFDGKLGAIVSRGLAADNPHVAIIDATGARIGDELIFGEPEAKCSEATPTASGVIVSYVDGETEHVFHAIELDAAADVIGEWAVPYEGEECPILQLDDYGPLLQVGTENVAVFSLEAEQDVVPVAQLPAIPDLERSRRWLRRAADGGLVRLAIAPPVGLGSAPIVWQVVRLDSNGSATWLPGEIPVGQLVPSPGHEFNLTRAVVLTPATEGGQRVTQEVLEVECNIAELWPSL